MKKLVTIVLAVLMVLSMTLALTACTPEQQSDVQLAIKQAQQMTWDELLQKAKEEIGNNELTIYGTTSRVNETTFTEKTGIKLKVSQPNDSQVFDLLKNEVGNGVYGADVVCTTDSFNVVNYAMANGWLENYVPMEYADKIGDVEKNPLVVLYYSRLFIYNNGDGSVKNHITNIWQLTEEAYKGCEVKSPLLEKCTMNFLITLTSPAWQAKLKDAYKSYYKKDWANEGNYTSISMEWIHKFISNCTFIGKDGTIASDIKNGQPGATGFFTLSKFRSVAGDDLTICAHEDMEGFSGMLFPFYLMVTSNSKYPYAACLYINYLMGQEGFVKVFGKDAGAYSGNTSISITDTALAVGDKPLNYWQTRLVIEDPQYIAGVYAQYYTRIAEWCASK